jgi:hypothetical protein
MKTSLFILNIEHSLLISSKSLFSIPLQKTTIGAKLCFVGHRSTGNMDDHGSLPGDTFQTLTRQRRPVALGEALSMLHRARHAATPNAAAMVIKSDQYDQ